MTSASQQPSTKTANLKWSHLRLTFGRRDSGVPLRSESLVSVFPYTLEIYFTSYCVYRYLRSVSDSLSPSHTFRISCVPPARIDCIRRFSKRFSLKLVACEVRDSRFILGLLFVVRTETNLI
ncbi:hypothetical protein QE152_g7068 [Popillia japonica]|uniref:Uncharacterized protein n=1 Tax=Popillia japonica TaxID=7064 RepID=A0AAW1MGD2_POPJA